MIRKSLTIFFIFSAALYNADYWKRRGVAGPVAKNRMINFMEDLLNPNYNSCYLLRDWTQQFGPVYGVLEGWRKVLVVADYKLAHEVLVKKFETFHARKIGALAPDAETEKGVHVFGANGTRWKRLRTIINPCFNVNNLKMVRF